MNDDAATLYQAYASRDPRFDGVFYVGVTSTGIYCRPVCTARQPKASNCRFFRSAAAAEQAAFRPCLRCRPELAPGAAPVDGGRRTAGWIAHRISEGMLDDATGIEQIATRFHLSSRQLRRVLRSELGVSPMELLLTRRLLLAKQLLTDTSLRVIDVAYSSGFSSLRRFNDAFQRRYGMPPTRLRRDAAGTSQGLVDPSRSLTLHLGYREPFNWAHLTAFLQARALRGVELIENGRYLRTVRIGEHRGWIEVRNVPAKRALQVDLAPSLVPVLPSLLNRLRRLFDLGARPDLIDGHLRRDPRLAPLIEAKPGLRVPGAFDSFELAARAILGQQVTVQSATTLAGRLAERFGDPINTPFPRLTRLSPTADGLATVEEGEVASLGIVSTRARSLIALAKAISAGTIDLGAFGDVPQVTAQLLTVPGIGPWTAQYIAMRALAWPDAFPKEDVVLQKQLGGVTPKKAEELSRTWSPWRSYATLYLWSAEA